jgi:hypothetical protein
MIEKCSHGVIIAGSFCIFGLFFYTVFGRLAYPYDLEWMEGGMLIHALRVMEGKGLYVEPSSDFIPYIYPPLYAWLLGGLGALTELNYTIGRGLSIFGSLLAVGALISALREENVSWSLSLVGGAFFLSTYENAGTFFDLTRADGCFVGTLMWALVAVRKGYPRSAGLLLFVSFLFKHNAAVFGLPCLWWLYQREGFVKAKTFALWSVAPALSMVGVLQWTSDGYFLKYLLKVPTDHPIVGYRLVWLSFQEIISSLALLAVIAAIWVGWSGWKDGHRKRMLLWGVAIVYAIALSQMNLREFPKIMGTHRNGLIPFAILLWILVGGALFRYRVSWRNGVGFWVINGVLAIFFSALMRGHHGGFTNVLIPGLWMFSLWMVLVLSQTRLPMVCIAVLCIGQLYIGKWNPERFIPSEEDRLAGDALVAILKESDGPVFAPHSPWLPVQAGHPPTAHLIAIWDIDHKGGVLEEYMPSIRKDFSDQRWGTVLSADRRLDFGRKKHYRKLRSIPYKSRGVFMPKIGWKVRPSHLFVPKE